MLLFRIFNIILYFITLFLFIVVIVINITAAKRKRSGDLKVETKEKEKQKEEEEGEEDGDGSDLESVHLPPTPALGTRAKSSQLKSELKKIGIEDDKIREPITPRSTRKKVIEEEKIPEPITPRSTRKKPKLEEVSVVPESSNPVEVQCIFHK